MNYAGLETALLGLIFIAAALFAIRHFLPGFFSDAWRYIARKKNRSIDMRLVETTNPDACETKCSACNGCSIAARR